MGEHSAGDIRFSRPLNNPKPKCSPRKMCKLLTVAKMKEGEI